MSMAKKNKSKTHRADDSAPLTPSQLVYRDNVHASEKMPADIVRRLAHRRLYLSLPDARADLSTHLKRDRDLAGFWRLDLPAKSIVGLPGRTAGRLDPKSIPKRLRGKRQIDGYRPAWVDHVFHPKLSGVPDVPQTFLRTIKGRRIRPTYVYGSDDRQAFYPSGYPWRCIGRVFVYKDGSPWWSSYGSGALVGRRHVLTAAHVAPWGEANWGMRFVPGYYDGTSVVGSGADSWVSDFRSLDSGAADVSAHDICLLRLYDPLGDHLGYFGATLYDPAWQGGAYWTLVGYPNIVTSERPSFQIGISVLSNEVDGDAMELKHHGDEGGGNSGGPFFGSWSDGPYVIGTSSGGETIHHKDGDETNNICAGGQALIDLIGYWRTNWP
jgi:hypothetical protein